MVAQEEGLLHLRFNQKRKKNLVFVFHSTLQNSNRVIVLWLEEWVVKAMDLVSCETRISKVDLLPCQNSFVHLFNSFNDLEKWEQKKTTPKNRYGIRNWIRKKKKRMEMEIFLVIMETRYFYSCSQRNTSCVGPTIRKGRKRRRRRRMFRFLFLNFVQWPLSSNFKSRYCRTEENLLTKVKSNLKSNQFKIKTNLSFCCLKWIDETWQTQGISGSLGFVCVALNELQVFRRICANPWEKNKKGH